MNDKFIWNLIISCDYNSLNFEVAGFLLKVARFSEKVDYLNTGWLINWILYKEVNLGFWLIGGW